MKGGSPAEWVEGPFRIGLSISAFGDSDVFGDYVAKMNPVISNFSYGKLRYYRYNKNGEAEQFNP